MPTVIVLLSLMLYREKVATRQMGGVVNGMGLIVGGTALFYFTRA